MNTTSETQASTQPPVDMRPAIIELLYAAKTLASKSDAGDWCRECQSSAYPFTDPTWHETYCPVARVYAAIESVREVLL